MILTPKLIWGFDNYDDYCIRVNDKILPGTELQTLNDYTTNQCCKACIENSNCKTASYNEFERTCILKSSFGGQLYSSTGQIFYDCSLVTTDFIIDKIIETSSSDGLQT